MADVLARQTSVAAVAAVLETAVAARLARDLCPDPAMEVSAGRWAEDPASIPVGPRAREVGVTERQLRRRFLDAVGYGPKRPQRVLRFQAFLRRSIEAEGGLAELAVGCGPMDQSHLSRETAALAGRTRRSWWLPEPRVSDSSKTGSRQSSRPGR